MKALAFVVLVLASGLAFAQGARGPVSGGGAVSPVQVLNIVTDAGTLTRADRDVYGNAFVASAMQPDGGTARYSFISNQDSCMKLGGGVAADVCAAAGVISFNAGDVVVPTMHVTQPACPVGQTCRWYSDAWGPGFFPRASLPACAAGQEGGMVALTTDHRPYFCDGTAAQRLAARASWSGALNFAAFSASSCQSLTFTATGAIQDEPVVPGGCGSVYSGDSDLTCNVAITAANTATVRVCCTDTLGCADIPSITFSAVAIR